MVKPRSKPKADESKPRLEDVPPLTKDMQRLLDIRKDSELWKQMIVNHMRGKPSNHLDRTTNEGSSSAARPMESRHGHSPSSQTSSAPATATNALDLLTKQEQSYIKSRLDQVIAQNNIHMNYDDLRNLLETCFGEPFSGSGFDPYGSEDESGLHEGNADIPENGLDQDDYEIEEVQDGSGFSYEYGPTRHIEVEVNSGMPHADTFDSEATCEFTFEYHRNGKLVQSKQIPASGKLEDKLRQLNLVDSQSAGCSHGKKNKKVQKTKKKTTYERKTLPDSVDDTQCLFCQYEAFFGKKPIRTMEWLERKAEDEVKRRARIKQKLNTAKMRTMRKYQHIEEEAGEPGNDDNDNNANAK